MSQEMNQRNPQQRELLDAIDKLRSLGLDGLLHLPQLVICGSPPAERAVMLQAISKVPFSQKGNFYSQYTTEVILRQAQKPSIRVSIQPSDSRSDTERQNLREFALETFSDPKDLPAIIEQTEKQMDISTMALGDKEYSEDVLRVEISGPEKPNLTLLDPPGLYTSTSKKESDNEQVVSGPMERYMSNPQSIILAVASANKDQYLRALLESVKRFDPDYKRVFGVIMNLDDFEPNSDVNETRAREAKDDAYVKLIKNESIKFGLGWHLLRDHPSISKKENIENGTENNTQEQWSSIPGGLVGLESLQRRINEIILKHTQDSIPGLKVEMQKRIDSHQQLLTRLGPLRSTLWEQWGYLMEISSSFHRITNQALAGVYLDDFFSEFDSGASAADANQHSQLRTLIRALGDEFANEMTLHGSYRTILQTGEAVPSPVLNSTPYSKHHDPIYVRREELVNAVGEEVRKNRSIELPDSTNQLLVEYLFRSQAVTWKGIAETHLEIVWESVRYFVSLVLEHLTNANTCSALMDTFLTQELENMRVALMEKLCELTSYINDSDGLSLPLPIGRTFLSKIHQTRGNRPLRPTTRDTTFEKSDRAWQQNPDQAFVARLQLSLDRSDASDIIDEMQAYYDIALVTFVDNIATLAIENCLIRPLRSVFSNQSVSNLTDEQICSLASESPEIQLERKSLEQEIERLQAGLQALSALKIESPPSSRPPQTIPSNSGIPAKFHGGQPQILSSNSSLPALTQGTPPQTIPSSSGIPAKTHGGPPQTIWSNSGIPAKTPRGLPQSAIDVSRRFPISSVSGTSFPVTPKSTFGVGNTKPFDPLKYPTTAGDRQVDYYVDFDWVQGPSSTPRQISRTQTYQTICCAKDYEQYSPEELRVGDYARGHRLFAKTEYPAKRGGEAPRKTC